MPKGGGYFSRLFGALLNKQQTFSQGTTTPIAVGVTATAAQGSNQDEAGPNRIKGASTAWFGPWQPLPPIAPPGTGGRAFDYQTGLNLQYIPRGDSEITFPQLRALSDALPLLRIVIEKRKDQVAGWNWDVQPILTSKDKRKSSYATPDPRVEPVRAILRRPDRRQPFHTWLRILLEDMLVIDAACICPRMTRGGKLYSLDVVDGSTIKQLINADGRPPLPEEGPAYQQILHGVPAADFALDELMYMPRNLRANRLYGYSPVEWILLTIQTALRREVFNLNYYDSSTVPEGFATLPEEWTQDQIQAFQTYFDSLMSGNLAERRKIRMVPHNFEYTEIRQPPLKDMYDEWIARIICAAFSIPPNPFVAENARVSAQTIQITSSQEGIGPLKAWVKTILDHVVQDLMGEPELEFVWSGDDMIDPLEKAQETQILVAAGIKTRDEARVEYGLDGHGTLPMSEATTDHPVFPLVDDYATTVQDIQGTTPEPAAGANGGSSASASATSSGRSGPAKRPRAKKPNSASKPASPKTPKAGGHKTPEKTGRRMARKSAVGSDARSAEYTDEADAYWESTAVLVAEAEINRVYTIPYLSNRSTDGSTVYIDENVPHRVAGVEVTQTLPWHELAEWQAMNDGMEYQAAHKEIATPIERRRVESLGGDWKKYCDAFEPMTRDVDDEAIVKVPRDLDLRPYEEEDDKATLREIAAAD